MIRQLELPSLAGIAPREGSFSWPNSWLSSRVSLSAAELKAMKG